MGESGAWAEESQDTGSLPVSLFTGLLAAILVPWPVEWP